MNKITKLSLSICMVILLMTMAGSAVIANPDDKVNYDKYLIKALKDKNIGVRASAAQLLGERKVEKATKPLIRMLKREKNYSARIIAAIALYQIGDENVLPLLKKKAKYDNNKTVRRVLTGLVLEMETAKLARK